MATVPVTRVWVAGEVVTDAYMNNNISAVLNFLLARPICQVRQTAAQSIPNNTTTALLFDAEDVDSSGMHSTVSNTSRMTAVYPGWYDTRGSASQAANANGRRICGIRANGADVNASQGQYPATALLTSKVAAPNLMVYLNVSDYLEITSRQESGGALNTAVGASDQSFGGAIWTSN